MYVYMNQLKHIHYTSHELYAQVGKEKYNECIR
nr:MAG TPA: hypothetical protein [Bacteriophage sp.]